MEYTAIAWVIHTFNAWIGCLKIADGCLNCYAWADRFYSKYWDGRPYMIMSDDYWKKPLKWEQEAIKNDIRIQVFAGSYCDVFDKDAPEGQRERLFELIRKTPHLDWLLLTKRAPNIKKYLPKDWGDKGWKNVWLGVTVENKKQGLPRIDYLRDVPAYIKFLSIEPLLEDLGEFDLTGIDWVIVGGESGSNHRTFKKKWVYKILDRCLYQDVPFFFKQVHDKHHYHLDGKVIQQYPYKIRDKPY